MTTKTKQIIGCIACVLAGQIGLSNDWWVVAAMGVVGAIVLIGYIAGVIDQ